MHCGDRSVFAPLTRSSSVLVTELLNRTVTHAELRLGGVIATKTIPTLLVSVLRNTPSGRHDTTAQLTVHPGTLLVGQATCNFAEGEDIA